ncbi:adenylosuccinate lyase, partial [Candidatus Peregrinibacteria bacterium]|nr:adenylosuccinate lyase [Candidatus Peregrinibacteria bacterium]
KAYPRVDALSGFVHFGCTSEDINSTAYSLLLKDFGAKEFMPLVNAVILEIESLAKKYRSAPLLSRTHGQAASPTTLGKELLNAAARLHRPFDLLKTIPRTAKWSGAVGNFNAHAAAYPDQDWIGITYRFLTYLGLSPNLYTTQIEPHDMLAERFDAVGRINTILLDFSRDMWMYISHGVFLQKPKQGEVGSSTMPHKVNPIDFENAEGNLGLANAIFRHLAEKLPISRLQRDLSDSTVMRNIGVAFGHSLIAYRSILAGLQKIEADTARLESELNEHWEVLTEAVQTIMRKYRVPAAYEKLKSLARGKKMGQKELHAFIRRLKIPNDDKKHLLSLNPQTYTGLAEKLVEGYFQSRAKNSL